MTTRKQSAAAKAKQEDKAKAEATEAKDAPVPETAADAVAPNTEQEAQVSAEATEPTPEKVTETPSPADAVAPDAEQITADGTPTDIQSETITGDGTGNALPPIWEQTGVMVRTKRRIKSRRRAGQRFSREGTFIALEDLSEEQLKQLHEDPALEVKNSRIQLNEATSEPEA
tara:strand:+ start:21172 stop:21687 length:516 start_codon:yes stop_codon:yes gene_type:complete